MIPATEYYQVGHNISAFSTTAIPVPLFHITQSATSSTVVAKLVLDKGGNTVLFWSPIDSGNIPDVDSTEDASERFSMGAAVKIQ